MLVFRSFPVEEFVVIATLGRKMLKLLNVKLPRLTASVLLPRRPDQDSDSSTCGLSANDC